MSATGPIGTYAKRNNPAELVESRQFYEFRDFSAARAFTEKREREIAEVEEEIELEDDIISYGSHDNADSFAVIYRRILAVEQARLAELRRGMKEGSE